jgi:hypothetical protein
MQNETEAPAARGPHLALVDVVNVEGLQDLGLHKVPDAGLGHDGDGDRRLDRADHGRVAHARDAAVLANIGGHALQRHDRDGAGLLGDAGLLRGGDVHDDAALEHLGEANLGEGGGVGERACGRDATRRCAAAPLAGAGDA